MPAGTEKEYGEMMRFLLFFREQYGTDEEFNRFIVESLRELVYDLREFEVYISINPESLRRPQLPRRPDQPGLDSQHPKQPTPID